MEITSTAYYKCFYGCSGRDMLTGSNQEASNSILPTEASTASDSAKNAVTSGASSRVADDTLGALTQEQEVSKAKESSMGDTSWFEEHNYMTESDRKLLGAMTGYTVDELGVFYDENGQPGFPEGLSNYTLRIFILNLQDARHGRSNNTIQGEDISVEEFKHLMEETFKNVSGIGDVFNEKWLENGLDYLKRRSVD